jgi:hypothetical protein
VGEGGGLSVGVDLDDFLRDGWEGEGENQDEDREWRATQFEHGHLSRKEHGNGWFDCGSSLEKRGNWMVLNVVGVQEWRWFCGF